MSNRAVSFLFSLLRVVEGLIADAMAEPGKGRSQAREVHKWRGERCFVQRALSYWNSWRKLPTRFVTESPLSSWFESKP